MLSEGEDFTGWQKVPRRTRKNHVELRDLRERDFIDLIDGKNQDKRYYGWLNYKPFDGPEGKVEREDPSFFDDKL